MLVFVMFCTLIRPRRTRTSAAAVLFCIFDPASIFVTRMCYHTAASPTCFTDYVVHIWYSSSRGLLRSVT